MAVAVEELLAGLGRGERRALARLLTVVEEGPPEVLRAVVAGIHERTGGARIIGVTGAPGVGKSTLTNGLVTRLRSRHRSVAVLAVDPSSPFSGGALLGDRVRMQEHHADPNVFVRSMASRGHLGGLAFATPQAVLVFDAAGFDDVIVETVGVGQSEVEVVSTADTTVVAIAPGMGDGVQAAKAGILEAADVLVVNKADHHGAARLEADLRRMLELGRTTAGVADEPRWQPPIVRAVAVRGEGTEGLLDAVDAHGRFLDEHGGRDRRVRMRAVQTIREIALAQVRRRVARYEAGHDPLLAALARRVVDRELDPYAAADAFLDVLDRGPD